MSIDHQLVGRRSRTVSRLRRNVVWLLGGQGLAGLFGLLFLAIAARTLRPAGFGLFVVSLTYGQLFSNISHFESWKAVVRFGALQLAGNRPAQLSRLLGFTATVDWISAVIGASVAVAGALLIGPLINWSAELQRNAALFAAVLILSSGGTPTGILRLLNRFDLLAYTEAVAPVCRIVVGLTAWLAGGGIAAFLGAWAVGAFLQQLATWLAALSVHPGKISVGPRGFRTAQGENPGLWHFLWRTSLSSSLRYLSMQAGTLFVGVVAGPATAGGFRLAERIATATTKPTEQLARVIYPELAHLVASDDRELLRRLFKRSVIVSSGLAVIVVAVCVCGGSLLLRIMAGPHFDFAQPYLAVLAVAAAIELSGFTLEPWHNAHGGAAIVLRARLAGAAVYALLLLGLLPTIGAMGAAIAAVASSAVIVSVMAFAARSILEEKMPTPQIVRK